AGSYPVAQHRGRGAIHQPVEARIVDAFIALHQRGLPGPEPGMEAKQPGQGAEGLLAFGLERRRPDGFGGVHAVSSDCQVSVRDPYSGRERRLLRPPVPRPGEAGMARPIWSGAISFGLLNIPVSLMPGARSTDLSFRMLDSRDRNPI